MSAGTGVLHSEYNLGDEELRLLQIWIKPLEQGLKPSYQQKSLEQLPLDDNGFHIIATAFAGSGSDSTYGSCLKINQDIEIKLISNLEAKSISFTLGSEYNNAEQAPSGKKNFMAIYLHVVEGAVDIELAGAPLVKLSPRDGFFLEDEGEFEFSFEPMTKCLFFYFS